MNAARRRLPTLAVLALALSGCAPARSAFQDPVMTEVQVEDDEFSAQIAFVGLDVADPEQQVRFLLRSWVARDGSSEPTHQVYARTLYQDHSWRRYRAASGLGGVEHEFRSLNRDVSCRFTPCMYEEDFGITLPHDVLVEHRAAGYAVRVYAQTGHDLTLALTPAQIDAQLTAIEAQAR